MPVDVKPIGVDQRRPSRRLASDVPSSALTRADADVDDRSAAGSVRRLRIDHARRGRRGRGR